MDDALQRYIQRALELADQRQDSLNEQDLADIARELGLTNEDLARVEQAIADHLERGRGYADHGMWDDAIRELEEAAAVAPSRIELKLSLARALTERWAATDFPDDKRRAEELVRSVIDTQANNKEAFALLARLNPTSSPPPKPTQTTAVPPGSNARRGVIMMAVLSMFALGVAGAITSMVMSSQPPSTPPAVIETAETSTPPEETGELELPVEFTAADGLAFHTLRSRLARYPEKAFYTLWGDFEVTGDVEFEEIEVGVKLLDDDGAVLTHEVNKAWGSHEATLRKGDHAVFTMLVEAHRNAKSVALEVVRAERQPAKGPYAAGSVVEPSASVDIPDHLQLEIRERRVSFSAMMDGPKGFFEATWEFANVGEVPIRELTYLVDIYDGEGEKLATKKKLATFASNPPIGPGDVILESTIEMIDREHRRYELTIIELE